MRLTKYSVDTTVIFRVVGDLSVFSEDDLASGGDHTKLGDVNFDDGTLGQYAELSVDGGLRVFLDTENL